jgi:hypothetical protein
VSIAAAVDPFLVPQVVISPRFFSQKLGDRSNRSKNRGCQCMKTVDILKKKPNSNLHIIEDKMNIMIPSY